jgi:hypothetical protein
MSNKSDFAIFPEIIDIDHAATAKHGLVWTVTLLDDDGLPVKVKTTLPVLIRYGYFRRAARRQVGINLRNMPAENWRLKLNSFAKRRRTA